MLGGNVCLHLLSLSSLQNEFPCIWIEITKQQHQTVIITFVFWFCFGFLFTDVFVDIYVNLFMSTKEVGKKTPQIQIIFSLTFEKV